MSLPFSLHVFHKIAVDMPLTARCPWPFPSSGFLRYVPLFQVHLTILSAADLSKADVLGSTDPYAVVLVNRSEIGRTRTLSSTQNPVWSEPQETFLLTLSDNPDDCDVVVQLWDKDLCESMLRPWAILSPHIGFL